MSVNRTPSPINPLDHLGLVQDMVGRYIAQGIDRRDLFQEGFLGLTRAIELYNPSQGAFSTYANHWIKHYVSTLALNYNRAIKIPPKTRSLVRGVRSGRLDPDQLAPAKQAAIAAYETHTLHDGCDEERPYLPMIAGREPCPVMQASARNTVKHLLRALTADEREIVTRYFGLGEGPEESCRQIAARRGVTWQRVNQILNRAISRMRLRVGIKSELRIKCAARKKKVAT